MGATLKHKLFRLFVSTALTLGMLFALAPPGHAAQGNPVDINVTVTVLPEIPPDAISDLTALEGSVEGEVRLNWTSPGDDGTLGDLNGKFYIRRDTSQIASFTIPPDVPDIVISTFSTAQSAQAYVAGNLEPGNTYYFALLAEDDLGKRSSWSTVGVNTANSAPALDIAPPTPSNFQAVPGDQQVTLSWNAVAVSDLDFYRVDIDSTTPFDFGDAFQINVDSPSVSFIHSGLTNNNTYFYRLASVDKGSLGGFAGNSLASSLTAPISTVPVAGIPPAGISNLTALSTAAEGEIQLSWTAPGADEMIGTAASYIVKYATSQITSAGFSAAATLSQNWTPLSAGSTETRIVSGLTPQTTIYFAIKAQDSGASLGVWNSVLDDPTVNTANFTFALEIPPAAITDLVAQTSSDEGAVLLTWTSPGDDGILGTLAGGRFRIDYSTNPNAAHLTDPSTFIVDISTTAVPGQVQQYVVIGLSPGVSYAFRVYALDERFNVSVSSPATGTAGQVTDTTPPQVTGFTPSTSLPGVIAADVALDAAVTLTFSEPMNPASLPSAFRLRAVRDRMGNTIDRSITGTLTYEDVTLTFRPNESFKNNETYEITMTTAAADLAGNGLKDAFTGSFRTLFNNEEENVMVAPDGRTRVVIPAGALPDPGYLNISLDPMTASFASLSGLLQEANEKVIARRGQALAPLPTTIREFQLVSMISGLEMNSSLQKPMELHLPYDDPDNDGYIEEKGHRIHERFLGAARLDEERGMWVVVPGADVDRNNNEVVLRVPHFSAYAIMPVATNFVGDAFAFPVPFMPSKGHTKITFTDLALDTTLRIYTVSGELVREIREADGDGQTDWDVKNDQGEDVFSGVYIYLIQSGSEKKTGKLVIIR